MCMSCLSERLLGTHTILLGLLWTGSLNVVLSVFKHTTRYIKFLIVKCSYFSYHSVLAYVLSFLKEPSY